MTAMRDKVSNILTAVNGVRDSHVALERLLSGGPASFYFQKINDYIAGLFSFASFKVDDRVVLAHDIDCNHAPGWGGCEHFLKKGAAATVRECDFTTGFQYAVEFDEEIWIDRDKVIRPVLSKHTFWLREADLKAMT